MNESHHNIFIHGTGVDEESLQHQLITTFSHDGATVVDATETSKYIICVDNNEIQLCSTVEPPNKGHIGSRTYIHSVRRLSLSWKVPLNCTFTAYKINGLLFI